MNLLLSWYLQHSYLFVNVNVEIILKGRLYNEHYPSVLVTLFEKTVHLSGKNEALRWSILVGKQKDNVQKHASRCVKSHRTANYDHELEVDSQANEISKLSFDRRSKRQHLPFTYVGITYLINSFDYPNLLLICERLLHHLGVT